MSVAAVVVHPLDEGALRLGRLRGVGRIEALSAPVVIDLLAPRGEALPVPSSALPVYEAARASGVRPAIAARIASRDERRSL